MVGGAGAAPGALGRARDAGVGVGVGAQRSLDAWGFTGARPGEDAAGRLICARAYAASGLACDLVKPLMARMRSAVRRCVASRSAWKATAALRMAAQEERRAVGSEDHRGGDERTDHARSMVPARCSHAGSFTALGATRLRRRWSFGGRFEAALDPHRRDRRAGHPPHAGGTPRCATLPVAPIYVSLRNKVPQERRNAKRVSNRSIPPGNLNLDIAVKRMHHHRPSRGRDPLSHDRRRGGDSIKVDCVPL